MAKRSAPSDHGPLYKNPVATSNFFPQSIYFAGVALAAAGFAAAGFAAGAFAGAFAAGAFAAAGLAAADLAAGFAAGAFFAGADSAALAGAAAGFLAPGMGFFVPIGVRFAGGALVLVVAEGALGGALAALSKLADGPFFTAGAGDFLTGLTAGLDAAAAGFEAGVGFAFAAPPSAGTFLTGAEEANFLGAAAFFAGTALPVVLLRVELTVSL